MTLAPTTRALGILGAFIGLCYRLRDSRRGMSTSALLVLMFVVGSVLAFVLAVFLVRGPA